MARTHKFPVLQACKDCPVKVLLGVLVYLGLMVATGKLLKARREEMESEERAQQALQELRVLQGDLQRKPRSTPL